MNGGLSVFGSALAFAAGRVFVFCRSGGYCTVAFVQFVGVPRRGQQFLRELQSRILAVKRDGGGVLLSDSPL